MEILGENRQNELLKDVQYAHKEIEELYKKEFETRQNTGVGPNSEQVAKKAVEILDRVIKKYKK